MSMDNIDILTNAFVTLSRAKEDLSKSILIEDLETSKITKQLAARRKKSKKNSSLENFEDEESDYNKKQQEVNKFFEGVKKSAETVETKLKNIEDAHTVDLRQKYGVLNKDSPAECNAITMDERAMRKQALVRHFSKLVPKKFIVNFLFT